MKIDIKRIWKALLDKISIRRSFKTYGYGGVWEHHRKRLLLSRREIVDKLPRHLQDALTVDNKLEKARRKREKRYLAHKGVRCPFCQSENIRGGTWEADATDANGASQEVSCEDCNREWLDLYTLTGIMEV